MNIYSLLTYFLIYFIPQIHMMSAERRKHILMFDSRGVGLQSEILKVNSTGIDIEAWFFRGANYERLKDEADYYAKYRPFDIIYIIGGVNELTRKDTETGKYYFHWKDYQELENHMLERLDTVKRQLEKSRPVTTFVFCPMIGIDLEESVKDKSKHHQEMVDNVTWTFNEAIREIYRETNIYVPDFARPVHRQYGEERKNNYQHLRDGLHLTKDALTKWANIAKKVADKN